LYLATAEPTFVMGTFIFTLVILFVLDLVDAKSAQYYEMIQDMNDKKEYYSILGVERDANSSAIKTAVCSFKMEIMLTC
jgi:hypothetical protein